MFGTACEMITVETKTVKKFIYTQQIDGFRWLMNMFASDIRP